MTGPYESLRDYIADLEKRNKLLRIKEVIDQDKYESTALMYILVDRFREHAPAIWIERFKQRGKIYETPVIGNIFGGTDNLAMCFGVENITESQSEMYDASVKKMESCLSTDMKWKLIPPVVIDRSKASCKEVVLKDEEIDLYKFPWVWNNPGDGGQYISSGCFIMEDPELGRNLGTYRMQVREKNKTGANFGRSSHAYQFMLKAADKGAESVRVAVAAGIDPISWMMSCTRLADLGNDEFALAGGFRNNPVKMVKAETSDILVPAEAEFIFEGVIPMDVEKEGPYGEFMGYMGQQEHTFYIKIDTITHRKNPIIYNCWPGIERGLNAVPWGIGNSIRLKRTMSNLVKFYMPIESPQIAVASIDKKFPGEGTEAGMAILGSRLVGFTTKVIIIVDKDVDAADIDQVLHAVGTRWQPFPATEIIKNVFSIPNDPSQKEKFMGSKIIIDATRQLPQEGGPEEWVPTNRSILLEKCPESFELVKKNWDKYFQT